MKVPAFMLKKLYVPKSLANEPGGFHFRIKNTLVPATLVGLPEVAVDGEKVDAARLVVVAGADTFQQATHAADHAVAFKKDMEVTIHVKGSTLPPGRHVVNVKAKSKEFDVLSFDVDDTV